MSLNVNSTRIRKSVHALNRENLTEVQRNVQLFCVASEARTITKADKRKKAVFGRKVLGPIKYRSIGLWEQRIDFGSVKMSDEPDVKKSSVCQRWDERARDQTLGEAAKSICKRPRWTARAKTGKQS